MQKSEFVIILDQSGSTYPHRAWMEERLNALLQEAQRTPGEVRFSLFVFHHLVTAPEFRLEKRGVDSLARRLPEHLASYGASPLFDAICKAVDDVSRAQSRDPSDRTRLVVLTDGKEAGSVRTARDAERALQRAKKALGWKVDVLLPEHN